MNNQFIYFTSILALMAISALAVSAQENAIALNNTTLNNTTLNITLNKTALNVTAPVLNETASALNETSPALNETAPANVTTTGAVLANGISASTELSVPQVKPIGSSENAIFVIGTGLKSNEVFQINSDNAKSQKNFEVGITVKPLKDLSKMMFVCNIV